MSRNTPADLHGPPVNDRLRRNGSLARLRPVARTSWFRQRPALAASLGFSEFKQCATDGWRFGFARLPFHTMLVDLDSTPEAILGQFQPRTRSMVRKAQRIGVVTAVERDHCSFLEFYNRFAQLRGLAVLPPSHVLASAERSVVTKASLDGQLLVTRGYLIDRVAGRARNLVNAAIDEPELDPEIARMIGSAHRCLIYEDMLRFRADGLATYDFGGYAVGTTDAKLANINRFKDSFGGRIVAEPTYRSWPLHIASLVRARLRGRSMPGGVASIGFAA